MQKEEIVKMQKEVAILKTELAKYQKLFAEDGHIDTDEQQKLNDMQSIIRTIVIELDKKKKEFSIDAAPESGIAGKNGNKLTIKSNLVFYGTKAIADYCSNIVCELEQMWNEPDVCVNIDDINYKVVFEFTYQVNTVKEVTLLAQINKTPENNFIRLEEKNYMGRSFMFLNDNNGCWITTDDLGQSTTAPHEMGHGYGQRHPDGDQRGKGQPGIMSARGTLVDKEYQYNPKVKAGEKGGTLNPRKRKVTEANVRAVVKGLKFNKDGIANVGNASNRIFDKWGR